MPMDVRPKARSVYLKGAAEGDRIVGEPVAADFVGRFVVAALAGTDYRDLRRAHARQPRRFGRADPLRPGRGAEADHADAAPALLNN